MMRKTLLLMFAALTLAPPIFAQAGIQCPSSPPSFTDPVSTFGVRADLEWLAEAHEVEVEIYHEDGALVHHERVNGDRLEWHGPEGHYFARGRAADCATHEGPWSGEVAFTLDDGIDPEPEPAPPTVQPEPPAVTPEPPAPDPKPCVPGTGQCAPPPGCVQGRGDCDGGHHGGVS